MKFFSHAATCMLAATLVFLPASAQMGGDPGQADMTLSAAQRQHVVDRLAKEVSALYVFPEQAVKVAAALKRQQDAGAYDSITSAMQLSTVLSRDLQATTKDKHLNVFYSEKALPERSSHATPPPQASADNLARMRMRNFGVERVEQLPLNIGYLVLNGFLPAKEAAQTLAAAMTLLAHTDALVIDLRDNGGGDAATVALLGSYFFDSRTHMTDFYYRQGNRTEQMWTSDAVPGLRYGQTKDVYVLTSTFTFSAAENFSYAMQSLKRATVVGEVTGGGANPGEPVRLTPHFSVFIPKGRAIGPLTNGNWEGTGVSPDVKVVARDALRTAQLAILKKMAATESGAYRLAEIKERISALNSAATAEAKQ